MICFGRKRASRSFRRTASASVGLWQVSRKLRLDFNRQVSVCAGSDGDRMAPDRLQLIQLLCTEAGIIMEDTSGEAVSLLRPDANVRHMQLTALRQAAFDIAVLLCAAEVLSRRWDETGNGIV